VVEVLREFLVSKFHQVVEGEVVDLLEVGAEAVDLLEVGAEAVDLLAEVVDLLVVGAEVVDLLRVEVEGEVEYLFRLVAVAAVVVVYLHCQAVGVVVELVEFLVVADTHSLGEVGVEEQCDWP